ncbi:MAG TPA: hypothetical protein VKW04_21155 [Planctomycetota bacterium]|nr:hypothetical protein [Planctomycetota bacterium]
MSWLTLLLILVGVLGLVGALFVVLVHHLVARQRREEEEESFQSPGKVAGIITLSELPPHRGLILNVCFYKVSAFDTPPPYDGQPPAKAAIDVHQVVEDVDVERESPATSREHPFALEHPTGYYYVEVRAILFRKRGDLMMAQVEQFFYGTRPLLITESVEAPVTFPVVWPADSPERLKTFGIFRPQQDRPRGDTGRPGAGGGST